MRIGCATAWSGDRLDPATTLVERGRLDYLFFDSMSETTMSGTQIRRAEDPTVPGYDPLLEYRLRHLLPECRAGRLKIVTNQGWLDPEAAAEQLVAMAREDGVRGLKVAAVLPPAVDVGDLRFTETGSPIADEQADVVSVEVYLGAREIVEALRGGADVVITPRVTDASLTLGPLVHELGWAWDDWDRLARGVVIGHLLECGAQVTGGNFADPGLDDVPGIGDLGHPIAEVTDDAAVITKVQGTGGLVSPATCKAQLLWEVGDPRRYLSPDVVADFTDIGFETVGADEVAVLGGRGEPAPDRLKALVGVREGFLSEEMILYAGPGALDRARMAETIMRERLDRLAIDAEALRFDYVGVNAVHREASPPVDYEPYEVALRVAVRARERAEVQKLGIAVAPMAVSGPTGTGKWGTLTERLRPVIGMRSTLIPRERVEASVRFVEA